MKQRELALPARRARAGRRVTAAVEDVRPAEVLERVGADVDNLSLSDRRAQSAAELLTQQFQVPAENLVTQGYGEQNLKVQTQDASRQNRRVSVRRITPLIDKQAAR